MSLERESSATPDGQMSLERESSTTPEGQMSLERESVTDHHYQQRKRAGQRVAENQSSAPALPNSRSNDIRASLPRLIPVLTTCRGLGG